MNTKDEDFEYVSAAMDGELSEDILDRLLADEDAQQRWREYHLIRDCLQKKDCLEYRSQLLNQQPFTAGEWFSDEVSNDESQAEDVSDSLANSESGYANKRAFNFFAMVASIVAITVVAWQLWVPGLSASQEVVATETEYHNKGILPSESQQLATDVVVDTGMVQYPNKNNPQEQQQYVVPSAVAQITDAKDAESRDVVHVEPLKVEQEELEVKAASSVM
ncbi:sigma-E factor negative regulatory protein [Neisseria weaveri]|uniref:sigma-E factor negative regulatory protein n=1 Tax=Neisseria weaveri TaxID=28091 RepID=UPI000D2FDA05|nr:sigma-E factor negative regulatory protein [Neisseria weaveri]